MGHTAAEILANARQSPANIRFADLRRLVEAMGYLLRRRKGSHHVFTHASRSELPMINLQAEGGKAKPYQVRQVLRIVDDHKVEVQ